MLDLIKNGFKFLLNLVIYHPLTNWIIKLLSNLLFLNRNEIFTLGLFLDCQLKTLHGTKNKWKLPY